MTKIVIGNWKMNLSVAEATHLAQGVAQFAPEVAPLRVVVAPSHPWLVPVHEAIRFRPPNFSLAAQAVSGSAEGAYTGDVAATQLKGLVAYCLVGHSERRRYHGDQGSVLQQQIQQLLAVGITPVVCFGEQTQSPHKQFSVQITRDLGSDLHGLTAKEIEKCLFAYEPLWAIGTGKAAMPKYIQQVLQHVQAWAKEKYNTRLSLLYGGSVTADNTGELAHIPGLDGLLVGGASLKLRSFHVICGRFSGRV